MVNLTRAYKPKSPGRETSSDTTRVTRYALLLLAAVFTVIGMFSVVIVWQDIRYERYDIERLRKHYDEYVNHVDNNFNNLWHEMLELQASAEADLSESRHSEIPMPYAYRFLKDEPDGQAFHLDDIAPPLVKEDIGNLTGDGSIKARSPDFYREIAMALKLMVDFNTLADSIPNLVWSYYYSKDYFAVYYPWTPSVETRFEKESYKLTAWTQGLPENNPHHEPYWTETYFDSVGKGLMVSCLAPIYDGDRFVGVVGGDLSVDFLNDFVTVFEPERGGVLVLYDQFDNFLAYPHHISASDKRLSRLKEGLPEALSSQAERLKAISEGQIEEFNGWRAMRRPLGNAPYNALYMEPVPSRVEALIQRIGVGTIALSVALIFFLLTSLALTHMRFVRPSAKFFSTSY